MKLHLNALGVVTPLGSGKDAVAGGLARGGRDGLVERDDIVPDRTIRVGALAGELPPLPPALDHYDCRNNRLIAVALDQIEAELAEARDRYGSHRIAVVLGTSTSGIAEGERALAARLATGDWPAHYAYTQQETGNLAAFVAERLGLCGPAYTISTACSSSGKVFASAERLIRAGFCDAAVVGGADTLCGLTSNGFLSLESIAAGYCNPFSVNRDGINIGEGAAVFLMEPRPGPIALLGVGESSDAYHISAPHPEGKGAFRSMEQALAQAQLKPMDIAYVNLHGTATPLNDVAEGHAIAALFGDQVPCSSTKGMTGHLLGAAAACEAAFLWLTLHPDHATGRLPPHLWDGAWDPAIPPIRLVEPEERCAVGARAMLSNSFAFGGSNVSIILGRA